MPSNPELDLDKLVYPLQAGYYCPEQAGAAAQKLTAALEEDPELRKQLPAALKDDLMNNLLTEDDEDIALYLRRLIRKLGHAPAARATLLPMMDARAVDGQAACAHWRSHAHASGDDPSA